MHRRFRVTRDFWSDELQAQYVAGLKYTARTERLERLVEGWVKEGKAAWITEAAGAAGPAVVAGSGVVSTPPKPERKRR